jgi:hypothetical protein
MGIFFAIETDPGKIRPMLEKVLSRDEFSGLRPSWFKEQLRLWVEFLKDLNLVKTLSIIYNKFLAFITNIFSHPAASYVVPIILFAAFGILLTFIIFSIKKRINLSLSRDAGMELAAESMDPLARERQADAMAKNGDFVDALRHLYAALLLSLDQKGVLEYSRSRTNREAERILREILSQAFREDFSQLNSLFEEKVYALQPCSPEDYSTYRNLYEDCKKWVSAGG